MSLTKRGAAYDNEICNVIDENTPDYIRAHSMRGSGNTKYANPDVLVRTPTLAHAIELKKAYWDTGTRRQIADDEDVAEMVGCGNRYTEVWFGISFSRRQLMLVGPLTSDSSDGLGEDIEAKTPDCFDVSYTESGYVRMSKPDTDEWPSAASGKGDFEVIAEALHLDTTNE